MSGFSFDHVNLSNKLKKQFATDFYSTTDDKTLKNYVDHYFNIFSIGDETIDNLLCGNDDENKKSIFFNN